MQGSTANLFMRDDTFFGVCEAIGEDFGFNPLFLRVAFGVSVLWNPVAVLVAYFGLGVIVLASRLLFPNPKRSAGRLSPASSVPASADDDQVSGAEQFADAA